MRDLSMHLLDIVMNSINAHASLIEITIDEQVINNYLKVIIKDNGCGMDEEKVNQVFNPFYTTRTTRKVGLGLPLLYENVKRTNGEIKIASKVGEGTIIEVVFNYSHIDRIPLGNIDETIISLITLEPNIDFVYYYKKNNDEYKLDTREIKMVLKEVPINTKEVLNWLKEDLRNKFS